MYSVLKLSCSISWSLESIMIHSWILTCETEEDFAQIFVPADKEYFHLNCQDLLKTQAQGTKQFTSESQKSAP